MAQRHSRSGECNRCRDREKKSFAWASAGDLTWSLWLRVDTQVRTCRCVFAHAGFECKFHPETLVVILLAVGPYEIASGKCLRYSMLIASLMAASQRSIVGRWRGRWGEICGSRVVTKGGRSQRTSVEMTVNVPGWQNKRKAWRNGNIWSLASHYPLQYFTHTNVLCTRLPWLTVLLILASCVCRQTWLKKEVLLIGNNLRQHYSHKGKRRGNISCMLNIPILSH